jgi:hypothetical protein
MDGQGVRPTTRRITLRAGAFVCAAGGIGTPGLLLRSHLPDPYALLGKRTLLHPTVVPAALMPDELSGYYGAPQTIYSDHFIETMPVEGPIGFKLEAPPPHPVLAAITLPNHGALHARWMRHLPNLWVVIAFLRDGFHPATPGPR